MSSKTKPTPVETTVPVEYISGVEISESTGNGTRDGIVVVSNVGDERDGRAYASELPDDFVNDPDAGSGTSTVKFSGGRSDKA